MLAQLGTYQLLTWDELKYEDWGHLPQTERLASLRKSSSQSSWTDDTPHIMASFGVNTPP